MEVRPLQGQHQERQRARGQDQEALRGGHGEVQGAEGSEQGRHGVGLCFSNSELERIFLIFSFF